MAVKWPLTVVWSPVKEQAKCTRPNCNKEALVKAFITDGDDGWGLDFMTCLTHVDVLLRITHDIVERLVIHNANEQSSSGEDT